MTGRPMMLMMAGMFSVLGGVVQSAEPSAGAVRAASGEILVAYYSYSGNTRFVAERIRELTGGELFEIRPVTPYPSEYRVCLEQARRETAAGARPALASDVAGFSRYKVVFVGTPNWWSTMAPPVLSFLGRHDFRGKVVIPFVTYGGGGMARCEQDMRRALPGVRFGVGAAFAGGRVRSSSAAIASWVREVVRVDGGKE